MNTPLSGADKRFRAAYLLILAVAAAIYAALAQNPLIWADEAYTMAMIRHSFAQIWKITTADVHPPLYYFLVKLVCAPFGYNVAVIRYLSSVFCLILMAVGGYQLRRLFNQRVALLFMVLYLAFPYMLRYSTECRSYALSELLLFLTCLYGYRCWKLGGKWDWLLFGIFGGLACYCHYFAMVSAGLVYLMLLGFLIARKQKVLPWLLSCVAAGLVFLPWVPSFLYQLFGKTDNAYWIDPMSFGQLVSFALDLFYAEKMVLYPVFMAPGLLLALICVLRLKNREEKLTILAALAVPLLTIGAGVAISILYRPMFTMRYAAQSIPLLLLFLAMALDKMEYRPLAAAILTVAILGGSSSFTASVQWIREGDPQRLNAQMVQDFPQCDGYVAYSGNANHVSQELSFYDPQTPIYATSPDLFGPDNPYPNRNPFAEFVPESADALLVFVSQGEPLSDPAFRDFDAEYLRTVSVSGSLHDLWYLQRAH